MPGLVSDIRRVCGCLIIVLLCIAASSAAGGAAGRDHPMVLNEAKVAYGSFRSGFEPVRGAIRWKPQQNSDATAFIRYELPGRNELGAEPAVYFWRYSMNLRVFLNGALLYDGGPFEPVAHNVHLPVLLRLPTPMLEPNGNQLEVQLRVVPGFGGYLQPPMLGSYSSLQSEYDFRYFIQISLNKVLVGVALLLIVLGVSLWVFYRSSLMYLHFAIGCTGWLLLSANPILHDLPVSMHTWIVLLHWGADLGAVMLLLFTHRQFDVRRPNVESFALAWVAIAAVIYVLLPAGVFSQASGLVHVGAFIALAYSMYLCAAAAFAQGRRDAFGLLFAYLLFLLLGIHDVLLLAGTVDVLWQKSSFSLALGGPIFFVALFVQMVWQLRRANLHADFQLDQARTQLEQSYLQRQGLERANAAQEERARVYQDLHDDVGAKLLDLVYTAKDARQAELAREALREIRTIATLPSEEAQSLQSWLAEMAVELRKRAERHDIALVWNVTQTDVKLRGRTYYHLTRVIRELVTNAIKHAQCAELVVDLQANGRITLAVADDGVGFTVPNDNGMGLDNVRKRVSELQGQMNIASRPDGSGTVINISIPINTLNEVQT